MSIVIDSPSDLGVDLRLDQSSGVDTDGTKDDVAISYLWNSGNYQITGLPLEFESFLEDLTNGLTELQLDNATDFEAAHSVSGSGYFIEVNTTSDNETINDLYFSKDDGTLFNGEVATYTYYDSGLASDVTVNIHVAGETDDIYLYSLEGGDILIGTTQSGLDITNPGFSLDDIDGSQLVFTYYLQEFNDIDGNPEGADVWGVTFQPLEHIVDGDNSGGEYDDTLDFGDFLHVSASGTLSFEFDTLESGKFLWVAVGDDSAGLLVTGKDLNVADGGPKDGDRVNGGADPSDAVNTSQGGQGATIGINNQMWTPGNEGVFTLVEGYTELGSGPDATGDNVGEIQYDDYINTQGAGIFISQTQGNTPIDMTIGVYQAGGNDTTYTDPSLLTEEEGGGLDGYIGAEGGNDGTSGAFEDDYAVDVDTVTVYAADGVTIIGTWDADDASNGTTQGGVTVTITDNLINVDGLEPLYTVDWTVYSGETFNRFTLAADSGKFDVGRVDVDQGVIESELIGNEVLIHDDGPNAVLTEGASVVHDESDGVQNTPLMVTLIADGTLTGAELLSTFFPALAGGEEFTVNGEVVYTYTVGDTVQNFTDDVNAALSGIDQTINVDFGSGDLEIIQVGSGASLTLDGAVAFEMGVDFGSVGVHEIAESDIFEDNNDDDQSDAMPTPLANVTNQGTGIPTTGSTSTWAKSAYPVALSADSSYGTDGEGSMSWSLELVDGDGTLDGIIDSGLTDLNGDPILLYSEDVGGVQVIVGRVDDDGDGDPFDDGDDVPDDEAAFALFIDDDGFVSLAQYMPIAHVADLGVDERISIIDGVLFAQLTVTDADGDWDIATEDIGGQVIFEDDGPAGNSLATKTLEEDDLVAAAGPPPVLSTGNTYDEFPADPLNGDLDGLGDGSGTRTSVTTTLASLVADTGADEPVSIALLGDLDDGALSGSELTTYGLPTLYSKGEAITYVVDTTAGTITGYADYTGDDRVVFVFKVTDNGDGTGNVNFTIYDQLDHSTYGDDIENNLLLTDPSDWDNSGDTAVDKIDFTSLVELDDADGDPVPLGDETLSYEVQDDKPIIAAGVDDSPNPILGGQVDFSTITGLNPDDYLGSSVASVTHDLNGLIGTDENDNNLSGDDTTYTYTISNFTDPDDLDGSEAGYFFIEGLHAETLTYRTDETEYITLNGDDFVVTTDAPTQVLYFVDGEGGTAGVYDEGTDTAYFLMSLDQDAETYTFTVLTDPPDAYQPFDFEDLPSGQNLFGVIASDKTDTSEGGLLLFPKDTVLDSDGVFTTGQNSSPTTNTSKGGGPVTIGNSNQMFDPGEGHYFVYVEEREDASTAGLGLDQNTSDDADTLGFTGTTEVSSAEVEIVQVQGGGLAAFTIKAYDLDLDGTSVGSDGTSAGAYDEWSRDFMTDPVTTAGTEGAPKIVSVIVYDNSDPNNPVALESTTYDYGTTTQSWTIDDDGDLTGGSGGDIIITFNPDGSVNAAGVDDDYMIRWETDVVHDMVLIEGTAGKYDIGGFNLLQDLSTPDQQFDFEVTITDFDGDQATSNEFGILVDGTGTWDNDGIGQLV